MTDETLQVLTEQWIVAVSPLESVHPRALRRYMTFLAKKSLDLLAAEKLDDASVRGLGKLLSDLTYGNREALKNTLEIFTRVLPAVSTEWVAFFVAFSAGFCAALYEKVEAYRDTQRVNWQAVHRLAQIVSRANANGTDASKEDHTSRSQYKMTAEEGIQTLLSFAEEEIESASRKAPGVLRLNPEVVNIQDQVMGVYATTRSLVKNKDILFEFNCPQTLGEMIVDPMRLRQILINLLSNAAKNTENGSIILSAGRENTSGWDAVVFSVRDTGCGMEPEKLRMYFDWFMDWDVSEPLRKPGRPMGLAICQHLCDLMGGEIFAESEVGKGTTMTVKLPAVTDTSKFLNYSDKNS